MTAYLHCNVAPGQFSSEFAVRGTAQAGEFSLFAPRDCVKGADASDIGSALLRVRILKSDQMGVLIELPVQAFDNGQAVTVDHDQIQEDD